MKDLLRRFEDLLADVRDTLRAGEVSRAGGRVTLCQCGCITMGAVKCAACEREAKRKQKLGKQKMEIEDEEDGPQTKVESKNEDRGLATKNTRTAKNEPSAVCAQK